MNPQNGQTPLDYLNQIAPQAPKKQLFTLNIKTVLLAGIALIILMVIVVNIANAVGSKAKEPWQRLPARLNATAEIVDSSTSKIKNSQLRSINSDLKLTITNIQRDLSAPLTAREISPTKLPVRITASESNDAMLSRLEDGRLNAKYDSTYTREMTYQLATILTLLQQLYPTTKNPDTQALLSTAYDSFKQAHETLSGFSASNE